MVSMVSLRRCFLCFCTCTLRDRMIWLLLLWLLHCCLLCVMVVFDPLLIVVHEIVYNCWIHNNNKWWWFDSYSFISSFSSFCPDNLLKDTKKTRCMDSQLLFATTTILLAKKRVTDHQQIKIGGKLVFLLRAELD